MQMTSWKTYLQQNWQKINTIPTWKTGKEYKYTFQKEKKQ